MAYIKTNWVDNQTPITAANMNKIENGIADNESAITQVETRISSLSGIGQPIIVASVEAMTDTDKIYLYVGSEQGYTSGHWYYYTTEWVDGGEYGGAVTGISNNARNILKYILEKVAYTEQGMQTYVDALYQALAQGGGGGDEPTAYMIMNVLTHVTSDNDATGADEGDSYTATLTVESGYYMDTVTVTMGGTDVTSTVYSNGVITISSVTGDIVITAVATNTRPVSYSNGYINDNGELVSASNNYVSNYYDSVTPESFIQIANYGSASKIRIAEYDSEQVFIKRSFQETTANAWAFKLSSTTSYIRVGFETSSPDTVFANYVINTTPENLNWYSNYDTDSNGELVTNSGRSITDFIPTVGNYVGININNSTAIKYTARCYDSSKLFLGTATPTGFGNAGSPTTTGDRKQVLTNTAYVRITLNVNSVSDNTLAVASSTSSNGNHLFKLVSASV